MWNNLLWLLLGGGLGTVGRYLLSSGMQQWLGTTLPVGTLGVNVLGCLAIGFLVEWLARAGAHPDVRLFLLTGVLGGFTTFSTFGLDVAGLLEEGRVLAALGYVGLSVVVGVLAVYGGMALSRWAA